MKFGIAEKHWNLLSKIAIKPLKNLGCDVWLFGSRARGDYKEFSDIDLLYSSPARGLEKNKIYQIKDDLEKSYLPYKVDLVDENELASSYRKQVLKERVEF